MIMKILVAVCGLLIGYVLNNYILTVNEDEKGEIFKCNFDKNKTLIILLWNSLIPLLLFSLLYNERFCVDFFRDVTLNALCSAVFFIDFRLHIIPDRLNLIAFVFGCIYLFIDRQSARDCIIGGVGALVLFMLIIIFSKLLLKKDGMGLGDAKFMCVVGLMSGTVYTVCIVFLSFIFGSIGATIALICKKKGMGQEIAFGPYIVMATMVMMFFGADLLNWYLNFLI